ncbi:MAG: DUF4160 domain-containing protein [Oscillospiraceae bacterium]|nr:DUF4160 domain-containing protein [Oscillospiraceae bacterium]
MRARGKHHKPPVHVLYGDSDVVIALEGEILAGSLPSKKLRVV